MKDEREPPISFKKRPLTKRPGTLLRRILIAGEGKTECAYFNIIPAILHINPKRIIFEVVEEKTKGWSRPHQAAQRAAARLMELKENQEADDIEAVWVLVDVDTPHEPHFEQAESICTACIQQGHPGMTMSLVVSNPSIEAWFLFHYMGFEDLKLTLDQEFDKLKAESTEGDTHRDAVSKLPKATVKILKSYLPHYEKGEFREEDFQNIRKAIREAMKSNTEQRFPAMPGSYMYKVFEPILDFTKLEA